MRNASAVAPLRGTARFLFLVFVAWLPALLAQDPTRTVFLKTADFWLQSEDRRLVPHPADITIDVIYCDPAWHICWGLEDGKGVFIPLKREPLHLQPGQRVRFEGDISTEGFDVQKATVLGTAPLGAARNIDGHIYDFAANNLARVSFEAYVDRQQENDPQHILLNAIAGGKRVAIRILNDPQVSAPAFEGAFVRVEGLYVWTADASNEVHHVDVYTTGFADIRVLRWLAADPRFKLPVTPIDRLSHASPGTWVHIAGHVEKAAIGDSLTLRDDTGQVDVMSAQSDYLARGNLAEAIGRVEGRIPNLALAEGFYRRAGAEIDASADVETLSLRLRLVDQVMNLSLSEAAKGYPVRLIGSVTWSNPTAHFFFLQDSSGGIRVELAAGVPSPTPGRVVEVSGTSVATPLTPGVSATDVRAMADLSLPSPQRLNLEQALAGLGDEGYVEIQGFLRGCGDDGPWLRADLSTPSGDFAAYLPRASNLGGALRSVVRVRGVCTRAPDDRGRPGDVVLWVQSADAVSIDSPFPAKPGAVPLRPIADLNRFAGTRTPTHWVRTTGTVTFDAPGRYLYLQDGSESLKVLSREAASLAPGTHVEVMGLQGQEGRRLVLREAIILDSEAGAEPKPHVVSSVSRPTDLLDGNLVRIEGVLADVSPRYGQLVFVLQSGATFVECSLPASDKFKLETPGAGALVSATGVYRLQYDEYGQPSGFVVDLRSPSDIAVLRPAPWWTPERALLASTGMLAALTLGLLWVALLRRRVREQTRIIRAQVEKEARLVAELERSARLESLGRLAGGIAHDFNNLLTIIIGNITLSQMEDEVAARAGPFLTEAQKGAQRARSLAQQLLTFARGGNPIRKPEPLADIIREAAELAAGSSRVDLHFEFEEGLRPAFVDRGQLGQAVHNLVAHAIDEVPEERRRIVFRVRNAELGDNEIAGLSRGAYLHVVMEDSGPALKPEDLTRLFDPYSAFESGRHGLHLATTRSIIKRHDGHIDAESSPDSGTRFHIWLPAAPADSSARAGTPVSAREVVKVEPRQASGRILFMDDEESIRSLAAATFKRLGCTYSLVGDGAQAVRTYRDARESGAAFDLVILDLTVPNGMGGKEAIEQLRRIDPEVRAIVSSGYSSDPVLADFRAHGFIAAVPKPYAVEELAACVQRVLVARTA